MIQTYGTNTASWFSHMSWLIIKSRIAEKAIIKELNIQNTFCCNMSNQRWTYNNPAMIIGLPGGRAVVKTPLLSTKPLHWIRFVAGMLYPPLQSPQGLFLNESGIKTYILRLTKAVITTIIANCRSSLSVLRSEMCFSILCKAIQPF